MVRSNNEEALGYMIKVYKQIMEIKE